MYEDLRKIRTERGIRLKECADVIGVQEACYCKKELGDLKFSLEDGKIGYFTIIFCHMEEKNKCKAE